MSSARGERALLHRIRSARQRSQVVQQSNVEQYFEKPPLPVNISKPRLLSASP